MTNRTPFAFSLVLALAACKSEEEPSGPSGCPGTDCPFDYASWNPEGPPVTLTELLRDPPATAGGPPMGILRRACNFDNCHGRPRGSEADLYLGPPTTLTTGEIVSFKPEDVDIVKFGRECPPRDGGTDGGPNIACPRGIIDVPAQTYPAMPIVDPGNPANSFLMVKIDGCFEGLNTAECDPQSRLIQSGHPCGDRMPQASETLCEDERDTIRRWIQQGAN